jgi:hypothetical protein
MTEEESAWDRWLDEHPVVDGAIIRAYRVRRWVRWTVPNFRERRRWRRGMFYLDHGSEPCVLVRLYDREALEGVSLVDGRLIGGCSIYACGPEPVTRERAQEMAERLRAERQVNP